MSCKVPGYSEAYPLDCTPTTCIRKWLTEYHGDREALARWMRDTLRIGGLRACRGLIAQYTEDK